MDDKEYTEKDWKLFRRKIAIWQENYINKLNKDYIELLKQDKHPAEKFWELEKRIRKDKNHPGVIVDMRRSMMIENVLLLLKDEVICLDDLNEFSDVFKESIAMYMKIYKL